MLLQNKNAVIYGAGGSIGGAVARRLASEGATIFLTGLHKQSLQRVADDIIASNGKAFIEEVDALDEKAVNTHIKKMQSEAGSVDISFNAIGVEGTQNILLADMTLDDFIHPIDIAMTTQFITATAAVRTMMQQRSGIILSITATPGGIAYPKVGGFGPACCAIEGFSRDLASEVGQHGIRVVNIRSAGSPDSRPFMQALQHDENFTRAFIKKLEADTMLKELPMMEDIANVAVFLASDLGRKITGVTIDVTCGTTSGLNTMPEIPLR